MAAFFLPGRNGQAGGERDTDPTPNPIPIEGGDATGGMAARAADWQVDGFWPVTASSGARVWQNAFAPGLRLTIERRMNGSEGGPGYRTG
ncbi:MAG: hypothetical protein WEE89_13290 [Gemmatimonadota bacterium]